MAEGHVFFRSPALYFPITIFTQIPQTHISFLYHRHRVIFATDSVVK